LLHDGIVSSLNDGIVGSLNDGIVGMPNHGIVILPNGRIVDYGIGIHSRSFASTFKNYSLRG
jgi:hypothetical protein